MSGASRPSGPSGQRAQGGHHGQQPGAAADAGDGRLAAQRDAACPLCSGDGGELVVRGPRWRVILAGDADHPAFTRVVWHAHVAEVSELDDESRRELFDVALTIERTQREVLAPDKINWASFGNVVPHLHWHVIPRWRDDRHFPEPVWGRPAGAERDAAAQARARAVTARLDAYRGALIERLAAR
ncbi:MAG: HIT family protein [Burkholderiaceae bacterium]